ncbi:hypothetical protein HMN09_00184700 [Mycena chlorophos]|uniref:Protein kinase domain-containing protein n=1 Tax=Mycena chlorophos TaxID=658473 RepID=A0A8H6WQM9_MYCCL|nr:hypothetical protein HMN09_00184700 [Mycena chlorophos]
MHPSNIGVAVTCLDVFSEMNFWDRTGAPEVIPVVARDPTREPDSFPPYIITENIQLAQFLEEQFPETLREEPRVRIIDFGCARFANEIPCPRWHTPVEYAAPELLYAEAEENNRDAVWGWPVDIWSLGCTIWAITTRRALFSRPILEDMVACDNIPTTWFSFSQRVTSECGDFGTSRRHSSSLFSGLSHLT